MPSHEALTSQKSDATSRGAFTLARANASLVLVRRIVQDITAKYQLLCDSRTQLTDFERQKYPIERREALRERCDDLVEVLNRLYRELMDIGCVLKDWRIGLVDFPAQLDGRKVWLCWRLGEADIAHWHELNDGFSGRKPTDGIFN